MYFILSRLCSDLSHILFPCCVSEDAPIPTKPTLARSNSTSRASGGPKPRKVPPISTSMVVDRSDPEVAFVDMGGLDSARDSAMEGAGIEDDDDNEGPLDEVGGVRRSPYETVL